jgi:hypothetical protein
VCFAGLAAASKKSSSSTTVCTGHNAFKIVATRDFKAGEPCFENTSLLVDSHRRIILTVAGVTVMLQNLVHTVNRGNGKRELYTYDAFMNHSCNPNTHALILEAGETFNRYQEVAIRDIACGEELTCDYEDLGEAEMDGTVFDCACGEPNCRGVIRG